MELEKTLLRKVGEAIARFKMIRDGDRVAVALSGGKDSLTMLEALVRLRDRAPIDFSVCAFTVEQGKFLSPIEPIGEYVKSRGIEWTYYRDAASFQLLEEDPTHGCDKCSRFRRRAVYEIARGLNCNVIAFGHTPLAMALWFGLVGFMLYGPDTLLCGAASVQVAGARNAVAVAGLVNGMGSAGSVLQEEVIGWLVRGDPQAGMRNTNLLALGMSILLACLLAGVAWRTRGRRPSNGGAKTAAAG